MLSGDRKYKDWTTSEKYNVWNKNTLDRIDNRSDTVEVKVSKLKDIAIETIKHEIQRKKDLQHKQKISFNRPNICIIRVPKRGGRGRENTFEKLWVKIFKFDNNYKLWSPRTRMNHKKCEKLHQGTL